MACLYWSCSGEAWVGGEVRGGVEVPGPVGPGMRYPELCVDGVAVLDGGEDDACGTGHAIGARLCVWTDVGADAVLHEDVVWESTAVGEPPLHRLSARCPESCRAIVDVAGESFGVTTTCRGQRPRWRGSTWGMPVVWLLTVAGTIGEVGHGVAWCTAPDGEDEVDGRSAITATVAAPTLLAATAGEDADGRGAAGLGMLCAGAGPHRGSSAARRRTKEVVGEGSKVDGGQECVAVEHGSRRLGPIGRAVHAGVGVDDGLLARAEDVVDDGGSATELPQRATAGELADDGRFGPGESEVGDGGVELVGGLAKDDLRGRVREETGGDLARGGAVVGLGHEVRGAVGDAEVRDAVGAAKLEAALEVGGGVAVREERPGFVEDLHALGAGAGHELLEPACGSDHDQRERVGVGRHSGEVHHDTWAVPAQRDGGPSVEHAAQRSGEQLVEGVRDRAHLSGEIVIRAAKPFGHRVGRVGDETGDIRERGLVERSGGDLFDRREHRCVLELGKWPLEHRADERDAHLSSAEDLAIFGLVFRRGTRGKRVDGGRAAGAELHRGETEVLGEGRVLPLRIRDSDPPPARAGAVDRGLSPQEALDERRLAVAGLAEHPSVRVRDEPGGVGLEGVPAELTATGEEIETDVGASVSEGALDREGVDAGDVGGGALVVAEPQ